MTDLTSETGTTSPANFKSRSAILPSLIVLSFSTSVGGRVWTDSSKKRSIISLGVNLFP